MRRKARFVVYQSANGRIIADSGARVSGPEAEAHDRWVADFGRARRAHRHRPRMSRQVRVMAAVAGLSWLVAALAGIAPWVLR